MENFEFQCNTNIIFGKDTQLRVGKETAKYGTNVLLIYGGGSIKKSGLYDVVIKSLFQNEIAVTELPAVKANPVLSLVYKGIDICKEKNIDFILAVGGGSVIDTAKAIGIGAKYDGDVWDFYQGKKAVESLPVGVVLTIPAAGSETSKGSVITNEKTVDKSSASSNIMRPVFAILNPELSYTLPNYQTACGCSDIMAHVMERYFTNTENVGISDRICESILKTIIINLPIALKENTNYDVRAEIMWAGTLAHNGIAGQGRVEDWASHDMEHPLSANYDIAHGAGLSVIFPAWMKYMKEKNPKKLLQFAVQVMNVEYNPNNEWAVIDAGIHALENFFHDCGLPIRLKELNIGDEKFEAMAAHCTKNGPLGNYAKLYQEDVIAIYNLAKE